MDLGKNYAGILAKIIFEAKNSKKMKFEDVLDIAKSDFMDALFDKILEGTFFCA